MRYEIAQEFRARIDSLIYETPSLRGSYKVEMFQKTTGEYGIIVEINYHWYEFHFNPNCSDDLIISWIETER